MFGTNREPNVGFCVMEVAYSEGKVKDVSRLSLQQLDILCIFALTFIKIFFHKDSASLYLGYREKES